MLCGNLPSDFFATVGYALRTSLLKCSRESYKGTQCVLYNAKEKDEKKT